MSCTDKRPHLVTFAGPHGIKIKIQGSKISEKILIGNYRIIPFGKQF
jgi:hypothetical protein